MLSVYSDLNGRDHSEDLGVDGKIILELILGNRVGRYGLDSADSRQGTMIGCCEHGNKPSASTKYGNFLFS
jgi:hypothetical protein